LGDLATPRILNTLVGRLAALQLLIYAALLPILFYRLDAIARTHAIDLFTRRARAYASSLARELELGETLESPSRTIVFLDGAVEGGHCVYAALQMNGRLIGSSVTDTPAWVRRRGDDISFSRVPDDLYAVALPIRRPASEGSLYLGFDKRPTLVQLRDAARQILEALAAYGLASIAVSVLLARLISRPLTQLRTASRRVARADANADLRTKSHMVEIVDLSRDLEAMRTELVGAAEKLRSEMNQRQAEQAQRAALENQLRHEQRLATIGTFAGGLAHEFNNILVPLMLYAEESLEEIGVEHPARDNLQRVLKAATRASNLISKVLTFSTPRAERPPASVELAAVVHEALDLSRALIPPNIELQRQIGALGEHVLGDPTLVNQVVLNLCSNAVHAMHGAGGTLNVTLAARDKPPAAGQYGGGRVLELRVRDTGAGIPSAIRERIFEPFFTTRDIGEGSGLGLSIVHGIVASMGGTICVSSILGQGTEFTVELPALSPVDAQRASAKEASCHPCS
jgi:signal transduction histidine kinase